MFFITLELLLVIAFLLKNKMVQVLALGASLSYDACLVANADARHNPDYLLYQTSYDSQWTNFEIGYTYLAKIFNQLGFSYVEFRTALSIFIFMILFISIVLLSKNPAVIGVAFNITLFLIGSIQIRNMAMLSIVLLGYAIAMKFSNSKIKYVGLFVVSLGMLIHSLGWLFFCALLLFFVLKSTHMRQRTFKLIASVTLFLALITTVSSPKWLSSLFSAFLEITKVRSIANVNIVSVYSNAPNHFGLFLFAVVIIILVLVAYHQVYKKYNVIIGEPEGAIMFGLVLLFVSTLLFQLSVDYVRLVGNIWMLEVVILGNVRTNKILNRMELLFKVVLGSVAVFTILMYTYPPAYDVLGYTIGLYENDLMQ
ncbi:EpsG family protein [Leuconostoc gasicomitatum]|uniref:EpsG family protein n=1 Tax=Leuconostoc gasicomitatum TaxID=115778 RepID=UPI000744BD2E|nr:EpsG family protein [Leuconostoc gasicomitatum]CUR63287.1 Transmembrane protein [Leuconostoc gasicomitatum KG16-1]